MLCAHVRASGRAVGGDGRVAEVCYHIACGSSFCLLFPRSFYTCRHFFLHCWQVRALQEIMADRCLAVDPAVQEITVREALRQAARHMGDLDARVLMQQVLEANHAYLIIHSDQVLTPEQAWRFQQFVERRAGG